MKGFGIFLLLLGAIAFFVGFSMDTTVSSEFGARIHNIGLMNDRQNIIVFAGAVAIIGAIFVGFASKNQQTADQSSSTRTCPFCAEKIRTEALICRFCQKELPAIASSIAQPKSAWTPQLEALSNAIISNDLARVKKIVSQGIDPHTPNEHGVSPLQMARNCEQREIIDLLSKSSNEQHPTSS